MKHVFILITVLLAAFSAQAGDIKKPEQLDTTGFRAILADAGKAFLSGQPTKEGLERLKEMGVTTIINLRTQAEMDRIEGYDEAKEAEELGMTYVHIPLGGEEHPYTPEALAKFAEAMKTSKGKPLVHCTVAGRASHMWAAYLAKYEGMDINEAVAHGRAANMGTQMFEKLLGDELTYSTKPAHN